MTTDLVTQSETWRECFERALDADPSDQRVRRDLADHLDELGDPDGEAVRWLANFGRYPILTQSGDWWHWYAGRHFSLAEYFPDKLWMKLMHHPRTETRREAERLFCRAYHAAKAAGWNPDGGGE